MASLTQWIVSVLVLVGALFCLLAALALLRMPDFMCRLQGLTKASTLGVGCTMAAAAVGHADAGVTVRSLLVIVFLLATTPTAAHALSRAAYHHYRDRLWQKHRHDDLATHVAELEELERESARRSGQG